MHTGLSYGPINNSIFHYTLYYGGFVVETMYCGARRVYGHRIQLCYVHELVHNQINCRLLLMLVYSSSDGLFKSLQ